MCCKHSRSFAACSRDTAPSTAACPSSTECLQRRSRNEATSNRSLGCSKMYWMMERKDFPNTTENTSSGSRSETVRQFWARFFSLVSILVSFVRYRIRSRSWRISAGGIKLGSTIPHIYRSQIHLASLRSVLLSFCGFVYLGCVNVTQQVFSRMLNTGVQHFPVDSMQASAQEYFANHSANSRSPLKNEEKRACLYSVRPSASVIPIQATGVNPCFVDIQPTAVFAENLKSYLEPPAHQDLRGLGRDWLPGKIESI